MIILGTILGVSFLGGLTLFGCVMFNLFQEGYKIGIRKGKLVVNPSEE